ncbi:MAG: YfhL family 4Fe-4S dicluster ferredoxin [Alphaproteobacteria bacterium]|nr:YfhL family 4Fe-4S dicluster ferredoxin [Alphaproteobacteria bacterium]
MALKIIETCTACDACEPVCPSEAIKAAEPIYIIDAFRCTECVGAEDEPQCVLVCPEACIIPDPDWEETPEQLQEKYDQIHS